MVVLMNHSVTTHALPGPCVLPLFDGVLRTCSNQPLPAVTGQGSLGDHHLQVKGEVVVSIIPNPHCCPAGKLADAVVIFEAASVPLSGMQQIGFAV